MTTVTTEQVQKDFASVLQALSRGETVLLEENGVTIGKFVPTVTPPSSNGKRVFGGLEGKIKVPDDFDEMMRDEIEETFYGKQ